MKTTKLLKILASLAIVASISACNGGKKPTSESSSETPESVTPSTPSDESTEETPENVTIAQATAVEFDSETSTFVAAKEGVLVSITDPMRFVGDIGNGRILAANFSHDDQGSGKLADQYGVEIELAEGVRLVKTVVDPETSEETEVPLEYTDFIKITGRVELERGRVVLKNANVEYEDEGNRRNFYWPADRNYFDALSNPNKAGLVVQGVVQFVSLPEAYSAETGATIKIVFPGEKTEDSLDNDFIIELAIPAGLSQEQYAKYEETFADAQPTDGFKLTFALRYNGSMGGVIPFSFLGKTFSDGEKWFEPAEIKDLYTDFDDVLTAIDEYVDARMFEFFEAPLGYSHKVNLSMVGTDYSGQSYCYINQDYESVARIDFTTYTDDEVSDIEDLLDAITLNVIDLDGKKVEWGVAAMFDENDGTPQSYDEIIEVILFLVDAEEDEDASDTAAGLFDGSEEEEEDAIYAEAIIDVGEGFLSFVLLAELQAEGELPSYTPASVAADIGANLGISLTDKGTYYGVTLNFSQSGVDYSDTQAGEDVLYPVISTLLYYMPDYLELIGAEFYAPEDDFWGDGSGDTAYYAYLEVGDVGVNLIAYCYGGYLIGQIEVYTAN